METMKRGKKEWFVRYPFTEWLGPWDSQEKAIKYSHMIFCVECPECTEVEDN